MGDISIFYKGDILTFKITQIIKYFVKSRFYDIISVDYS